MSTPKIETPKPTVRGTRIAQSPMLVGDRIMQLREPSIAATDEILATLFDDSIIQAIVQVAALYERRGREAEIERRAVEQEGGDAALLKAVHQQGLTDFFVQHASQIAEIAKTTVLPLIARKAGLVAAIALDVAANRESYGFATEERDGRRSSAALRAAVMDELSIDQALDVAVAVKEAIDWSGLGKKIQALLPRRAESAAVEPAMTSS